MKLVGPNGVELTPEQAALYRAACVPEELSAELTGASLASAAAEKALVRAERAGVGPVELEALSSAFDMCLDREAAAARRLSAWKASEAGLRAREANARLHAQVGEGVIVALYPRNTRRPA